jgi:hypothetical protein
MFPATRVWLNRTLHHRAKFLILSCTNLLPNLRQLHSLFLLASHRIAAPRLSFPKLNLFAARQAAAADGSTAYSTMGADRTVVLETLTE